MIKVRITKNYTAHIALEQIMTSDRMAEVVEAAAEEIASRARGNAPVESGSLRDSIRVVTDKHPTRAVAHVGIHVPYGGRVEARNAVLRRSLG